MVRLIGLEESAYDDEVILVVLDTPGFLGRLLGRKPVESRYVGWLGRWKKMPVLCRAENRMVPILDSMLLDALRLEDFGQWST